ncbi:MAG: hypothetical protein JO270_09575 [Acidobacteriaceae bacterium]|nr:hypothetical protein [Acidobacteriaceae bacterium]
MEDTTSCTSLSTVSATNSIPITIGTGDNSNLAYGLPLFPSVGSARAGISNTDKFGTLLDFEITILFSRTKCHASYTFLMGVLGPAIAFNLPADVTFTNPNPSPNEGQVAATLHDQNVVAGFGVGLGAGAGFSLLQQFYLPEKWSSPWKLAWQTVLNLNVQFNVDVITVLLFLILKLIGSKYNLHETVGTTKAKFQKYLSNSIVAASPFNFWGNSAGFGPNRTTTATPRWVLPIDFLSFVPPFKAFNKLANKINCMAQCGTEFVVMMPVTLSLNSFDVTGGGKDPKGVARYEPITYDNTTAKAPGPPFNVGSTVTRFTTNVTYSTSFTIALQFYFELDICKLVSKVVTTQGLDLLELMHIPRPSTGPISGSVSANPQKNCVLIPQMTMSFMTSELDPHYPLPINTVVTDLPAKGTIYLSNAWQGAQDATVNLEITPAVAGFPKVVYIKPGESSQTFEYTFINGPIPTGDPNDPDSTVSPSDTSPFTTYLVRANAPPSTTEPCDDWEVTAPVMVQNRAISTGFQDGTRGAGPPNNVDGGAQLNADQTKSPYTKVENFAIAKYQFPYPPGGKAPAEVEMKLYLLDADKNPHNGSDVSVTFDSGAMVNLSRPATVKVPLAIPGNTFTVKWLSKGPETNYSSLFFLVLDAGGIYGQSEFWLHVWNWS